mgnify:CR=1 FL=1
MASSRESRRATDDNKRKRTDLSFEKKAEILERLKQGERAQCIANEYDIGRRTVYNIKSREKTIVNTLLSPNENSRKRLATTKSAKTQDANDILGPEPGSLVEVVPKKIVKQATTGELE